MRKIIVLVFLLLALIGCGSTDTTSSTDTQPTPPLTVDQQINQLVQNAGSNGTNIVSHYNLGGDNAEVIDEQSVGGFSNGDTVESIKIDCFAIQKALWTSSVASKISDVEVRVNGQLQDQYGKTSNGMWGSCELKSDTAKQFVWDNLTQDDAWKVYDNTWILPSLTQ